MLNRRVLAECRRPIRSSRWNADAHLRAHERSLPVDQDAILRVDTCQLAANSPIEDFYSAANACHQMRFYLMSSMDMVAIHAVDTCLSRCFRIYVKLLPPDGRLQWLSSADTHLPNLFIESEKDQIIDYYKSFIERKDLHTVRDALKLAFEMCDENLCKAASPDNRGQIDRLSVATAAAGSCATLAHVRKGNLQVANVGDGAAVLGVVNSRS
ncbi:unnamed protein product [Cylicocyclus nassatus]|uniref:PPM-type phosphatase domain-containing protein n=1 Tax=Cylicocyclus nassatus TaxID=53992 RepID=A0AA36H9H0_CYLNA|nr:unnamed protein product [Cylicocyclus nassatus]